MLWDTDNELFSHYRWCFRYGRRTWRMFSQTTRLFICGRKMRIWPGSEKYIDKNTDAQSAVEKNIILCKLFTHARTYLLYTRSWKVTRYATISNDASVLTPPFTVTVQKGTKYTLVCQCCHKALVSDCPNLQCCSFRIGGGGQDRPALTTFTLLILVRCQYCLHGNIFQITHLFTGTRYVSFFKEKT